MSPAAKLLHRLRKPALSIGQLTFGGYFLVLAVIVTTGIVSMVAIRHLDTTFAELQRLQGIGDLAEEVDRRMNALRLAARDYVTDPGAPADRMWLASTTLTDLLKTTRLELDPSQQAMVDGVTTRLSTYRDALGQVNMLIERRASLSSDLPRLRQQYETALAQTQDRAAAVSLLETQGALSAALVARDPIATNEAAQRLRQSGTTDIELRAATFAYADAIGAIAATEREIASLDRDVLGEQGRKIGDVTELLRELSAQRGRELANEFGRTLSNARWRGILLNAGAVLIGLFAALFVVRRTVGPLTSIALSIRSLADGTPDVAIPATHLKNEVGDIARASEVFRRTLLEADAAREAAVRALAEQRLAEEGYRKLFEGSVDGIYVTTPNGQLLDANPALARMMGYDNARQLIESISDIAHGVYVDPNARAQYQARMMQQGMVREFEYEVRRRNGETLWLSDSATAVRDAEGQVVRFEGTVRDITDQRRAEAAAAESRRLLQQVIDTVPAVINVKTPDLRYVLMNRYMAGIFSIEPQDAIGRTTSELMSRYGAEKTDDNDRRVLASGEGLGFYEEEYRDASGAMRQWLVNKMPLRGPDGEIDSIVTVALDIGERKRSEQAMRAAKDQAEATLRDLRETQNSLIEAEKLAALGRLVAGVAHEVNNPVGISLTVASSLQRKIARFAEEVERGDLRRSSLNEFVASNADAAQQLVANLNRAAELVQSFKQVAADRNYSDQREFDLADLTEQVVMSLKPGLRKQKVSLSVDCAPGLMMNSYPGPYGQVLTNLFLNAVAHGFADGSGNVTITARPAGEHHVRIVFADDGRGMTPEVRRRAFDPFFTTRRDQGGTGLGLHIVYSIVTTRLGGRIALYSEPGQGTRLEITLPRQAPLEQAAE
jgi:PAS domain S-box-containing protein